MLTEEKLKWIRKNLRHGDIKKINKIAPEVEYVNIVAILNGRLWGVHGQRVTQITVEFLDHRMKKEHKEREKYADLLASNT